MEQIKQRTVGDRLQWESTKDLDLYKSPMMPLKVKHLMKVYLTWAPGVTYEAWLVHGPTICTPSHGRFDTLLTDGDTFECFVVPKHGGYLKGLHTLWLRDVGIGKTKKEAEQNYEKYYFFKRSKSRIMNDAYWTSVYEK
jgi:hypothetical protein